MARLLTRLVMTAQIVCVSASQLVFVVSLPLKPHASLEDCVTHHRCGCPAEMTAHKACCCFAGGERKGGGVAETLIRSAQCSGNSPANASPIPKLNWALVRVDETHHVGCVVDRIMIRTVAFRTRTIEPLVPPPKYLLTV